MTDALIQYIQAAAAYAPTWGFLLIILFMAVESSFIPFPSEVVMIPAGFLAARGEMTLGSPMADAAVAVLAGVSGSLIGAFINYYLFSWLGTPFLEKYGKYFLLPKPKLERAEEIFRKYGAGATFVCRLLPAIRQLISIPAGISRMPLKSFSLWTGLGAGIWVTILTGIGFYFGKSTAAMTYAELVHQGKAMVKHDLIYIIPACLLVFGVYVVVSNKIMKKSEPAKA
jgi:membrane protein DedA with SNARE-associated domain